MKSAGAAYDIIVVGGGHAGIEAAAAAARLNCRVLLVTHKLDTIGELSCNPAIGGVGKGQLVKEIDALGGLMGEVADAACIQYRRLNTTRGAAVQSTRMQVDMDRYRQQAQDRLRALANLDFLEAEVESLLSDQDAVQGVVVTTGERLRARAVILTPGTFFNGLIHIGNRHLPGGRLDDADSTRLPKQLASWGFQFGRFKTGTTPRLDGRTIDFSKLTEQPGDREYLPFSPRSAEKPALWQTSCYLGHTNPATHDIIRNNLRQSALYSGQITGTGVRYCPSVEDKIVKFPDRDHHHVFVEPEGLEIDRYYPNGLSNSLPLDVQNELVHSIPGLEQARIVQSGYGIEHDYLLPTQLRANLESARIRGLYFAGQINGTTGYEEAAAQGLLAGINAACQVNGAEAVVLDRSQAYIGVLLDDLVTKGTNEPYRMFPSRVEYRLIIREDNADERLTPLGRRLGLINEADYRRFQRKEAAIAQELKRLESTRVSANARVEALLRERGSAGIAGSATLLELLRRPEIHYADLSQLEPGSGPIPRAVRERVEVQVKYAGYIKRQAVEIERFQHLERIRVPKDFTYQSLPGISLEVAEKLTALQPRTLGQAGRISGVTPAALSQLMFYIKRTQAG